MNQAFADTFFYLALLDADDPAHQRSVSESKVRRRVVTTEFILLELGGACARAEAHGDFLALVEAIRASPWTTIVPLSPHLMDRGFALMANRPDKDWSLTDCISFVVMEDAGIHLALTGDHHFEQAGHQILLG